MLVSTPADEHSTSLLVTEQEINDKILFFCELRYPELRYPELHYCYVTFSHGCNILSKSKLRIALRVSLHCKHENSNFQTKRINPEF